MYNPELKFFFALKSCQGLKNFDFLGFLTNYLVSGLIGTWKIFVLISFGKFNGFM